MNSEEIISSLNNIDSNKRNHIFIQSLNGALLNEKEINDRVNSLCALLESKIKFINKDKILKNDCIYLITVPVITNQGEKSFNKEIGSLKSTQDLLIDIKYEGNLLSVFQIK